MTVVSCKQYKVLKALIFIANTEIWVRKFRQMASRDGKGRMMIWPPLYMPVLNVASNLKGTSFALQVIEPCRILHPTVSVNDLHLTDSDTTPLARVV